MAKEMTIGEHIKALRIEKGLSQKALGELCTPKMDASHIRKIESGRINPTTETLNRISSALQISIIKSIADEFIADDFSDNLHRGIIVRLCDNYDPEEDCSDDHEPLAVITKNGKQYIVEDNKLHDMVDRFIQHMRIEFDAFLESVDEKNVISDKESWVFSWEVSHGKEK